MLQSLHVHNFALLEDARVDFLPGFNVFTGETGAGKSILIDAFGLVLGGRASLDYLRSGCESFWVQAVFDISSVPGAVSLLEEQGIDIEDDLLFIKRQVTAAGKSRAYLNGVQVPVAIVKKVGGLLVDIHGQHENQALLHPDAPRKLIDAFGSKEINGALQEYQNLYKDYLQAERELQELKSDSSQQDLLLDRYDWEIREIKNAALKAGEEASLEEEARILQHSEKIITSVNTAHSLLGDDNAVLSMLAKAKSSLQTACRYDERLTGILESVDSAWINLDDCSQQLAEYLDSSSFNGERAAEVQERLDLIYRLQKKYGGTTEAVLEYLHRAEEKYAELQDIAAAVARAEKKLQKIKSSLQQKAALLSDLRKKNGSILEQLITNHIHDLAMPQGKLMFAFQCSDKFGTYGCDDIKIMFSANVGEPVNELEKVASGGELSRIALAVKTVMRNMTEVPTMVFDEIDTGVGGVTARKMAEKIAAIALQGQVLCITHLPQIAAFADRHIYIEKQSANGRTATELTILNEQQRINELMRMASGSSGSKAAYESAAELLAEAQRLKKTELLQ